MYLRFSLSSATPLDPDEHVTAQISVDCKEEVLIHQDLEDLFDVRRTAFQIVLVLKYGRKHRNLGEYQGGALFRVGNTLFQRRHENRVSIIDTVDESNLSSEQLVYTNGV